jgi:hypothetical protein
MADMTSSSGTPYRGMAWLLQLTYGDSGLKTF